MLAMNTAMEASINNQVGYISEYNLNLREEPTTNSKKIGQLKANTLFRIYDYDITHTWGREVLTDNWVYLGYAKLYTDDVKYEAKTNKNVNFRKGPGTNYARITTIPSGTKLDLLSTNGAWSEVKYNNKTGWVMSKYITTHISCNPLYDNEVLYTTANVNIRKGPGTGYKKICTIPKNSKATVIEDKDGWYHVKCNEIDGWISGRYLDRDMPEEYSVGTTTTALNLRSKPTTASSKIVTMPKGATIKIVSLMDGWAEIKYNGHHGYCSLKYIKY